MQKTSFMLDIRPTCENCQKILNPESEDAMICSYECTFCRDCVDHILYNVCPNCGGGFQIRLVRPMAELLSHPASRKVIHKTIDAERFRVTTEKYKNIKPSQR